MRAGFLSRLLFPPRCAACRALLSPDEADALLCSECQARWSRELLLQCPDCFCEYYTCRCTPPVLKRAGCKGLIKLFPYTADERTRVSRNVILGMKKHPRAAGFTLCAEELAASLRALLGEEGLEQPLLVYLPRARRSVARYGFDQVQQLSRELSLLTGIECVAVLKRCRDGKKQKDLTLKARIENTKHAFVLSGDVMGRNVILVDDVVTTGASTAAATKLLRTGKAATVHVLSIAYTEKEQKNKKTFFGQGIAF